MAKITTKEVVDLEVQQLLNDKKLTYKIGVSWIIFEAITMIILLMYIVMSIWTTYDWNTIVKILLVLIIVTVFYDVFYNFIWTRWIVLNESED